MARISSLRDVEALEQRPLDDQLRDPTVYGILSRAARVRGDAVAISALTTRDPDGPSIDLSYRELFARVNQVARLLRALEVGRDDGVAILLPNVPEAYVSLWAAAAAGFGSPLNPMLEPAGLAALVRALGARTLVTAGPALDAEMWAKAVQVAALAPELRHLVAVGGGDDRLDAGSGAAVVPLRRADELDGGPLPWAASITPPGRAACFHTGGTTAAPRLAIHLNANQAYMAWATSEMRELVPDDTLLNGLGVWHVAGAIVTGLVAVHAGCRSVLLGPSGYRDPAIVRSLWRLVRRFRGTMFLAPPTIYAALAEVPIAGNDVGSLRAAVCGSAPLPTEVHRRFERATGVPITEGYGLTEGTAASCLNPFFGERRVGSVGIRYPYQHVEVARLDAAGRYLGPCAPGEVGVVCVRGPNVFPGYVGGGATAATWAADGLLNTGDLGRLDADGYLWLTGRAKDVIIRGGHNIDPGLIEEALCRHPAVGLAAAVGRPDAHAGEVPVAYVELREGREATPDELLAFARGAVPERAAVPRAIHVLRKLPITGPGKIAKSQLRVLAARDAVDEIVGELDVDRGALAVDVSLGPAGVEVTVTARDAALGELVQRRLSVLPLAVRASKE